VWPGSACGGSSGQASCKTLPYRGLPHLHGRATPDGAVHEDEPHLQDECDDASVLEEVVPREG
jgi:hypothetical protein